MLENKKEKYDEYDVFEDLSKERAMIDLYVSIKYVCHVIWDYIPIW